MHQTKKRIRNDETIVLFAMWVPFFNSIFNWEMFIDNHFKLGQLCLVFSNFEFRKHASSETVHYWIVFVILLAKHQKRFLAGFFHQRSHSSKSVKNKFHPWLPSICSPVVKDLDLMRAYQVSLAVWLWQCYKTSTNTRLYGHDNCFFLKTFQIENRYIKACQVSYGYVREWLWVDIFWIRALGERQRLN